MSLSLGLLSLDGWSSRDVVYARAQRGLGGFLDGHRDAVEMVVRGRCVEAEEVDDANDAEHVHPRATTLGRFLSSMAVSGRCRGTTAVEWRGSWPGPATPLRLLVGWDSSPW